MDNYQTAPTPLCERFAPLLATLDDLPTPAEARAHFATCPYCQEQQQAYREVETALRRNFGPAATPRLRTEDIMHGFAGGSPQAARRNFSVGRSIVAGLGSLAAVLLVVVLVSMLAANHLAGTKSSAPSSFTPSSTIVNQDELTSISMDSPTDGWAVGTHQAFDTKTNDSTQISALFYHYSQGRWQPFQEASANGSFLQIVSISMVNAQDGWAIGTGYDSSTNSVFFHYDGRTWKSVSVPNATQAGAVQMVASNDGWAYNNGATGCGLLHYNGNRWAVVNGAALAQPSVCSDLNMLSAQEGWAAGIIPATNANEQDHGFIAHYLNGHWTMQNFAANSQIKQIHMVSATEGWAIGEAQQVLQSITTPTAQPVNVGYRLLLHYLNGAWHVASDGGIASTDSFYSALVMRSPTDGWLVANYGNFTAQIYHYDGQQWQLTYQLPISSFRFLFVFAMAVASDGEKWLVGGIAPPGAEGNIPIAPWILHEVNGTWTQVQP